MYQKSTRRIYDYVPLPFCELKMYIYGPCKLSLWGFVIILLSSGAFPIFNVILGENNKNTLIENCFKQANVCKFLQTINKQVC